MITQLKKLGNNLVVKMFPAAAAKKTATAAELPGKRTLSDFKVFSTPNTTTITISSSGPIENYTVDTIGAGANSPPRMYIDIEDVAVNQLISEKQIGTSVDKIRVAPRGTGVRIVFDSASQQLFKYTVAPSADGLNVVIDESGQMLPASTPAAKQAATAASADKTLDQLIGSSEQLLSQGPEKMTQGKTTSKASELEGDFSFSGYKKQLISVDFYKIDIHNVFRLFRQINRSQHYRRRTGTRAAYSCPDRCSLGFRSGHHSQPDGFEKGRTFQYHSHLPQQQSFRLADSCGRQS